MPTDEQQAAIAAPRSHRMPARWRPQRPRWVARTFAVVLCAMASTAAMPRSALAQADPPPAAPARIGAAAKQHFLISPGALAPALRRLASTANLLLTFTEAQTEGKRTAGIDGHFTPEAALAALLADTGLQAVSLNGGGHVLRNSTDEAAPSGTVGARPSLPQGQAATLAEVRVRASALGDGVTEGAISYTTRSSRVASGLNLPLRETPQSISVITRQQMDDQGLDSMDEVFRQTPGVSFAGYGPVIGGTVSIYARAYAINNYLIDGVAMPKDAIGYAGAVAMDTAIYDSVTVVRGATGLLTGAGEPSASINLTRKRPTDRFQASVEFGLGRWDQRRIVGDVGGPLNEVGTLRGRLVAAYDAGESWIDRYRGNKALVYGALDVDLGPRTTLNLSLEHARDEARGAQLSTGFATAFTDGRRTPFSRHANGSVNWAAWNADRTVVSAALEHRFDADWQARVAYTHSRVERDHRYGMAGFGTIAPDGMSNVLMGNFAFRSGADVVAASLNGRYHLWGRQHELVAGLGASDVDSRNPVYGSLSVSGVQTLAWTGAYPEPDWASFPNNPVATRIRQSGAYLATRLRATDALAFLIGGRWSRWHSEGRELDSGIGTDNRKESGVFTPYAAVTHDLTAGLSAYASYTTIFNPQSQKDIEGRTLDPEEGSNIELGLKGEWFGGRLNGSAAIFQSGKDNLAIRDGDRLTPDGGFAYRAEDDTRGRGWELEIAGHLMPGWQLQAGYTRMTLTSSAGALLNTALQPKHQVKLFTTWTPANWSRLTVGGGLYWQSDIYDASNALLREARTQKGYALVNLMGHYAVSDRLGLSLHLSNLFDKSYRVLSGYHVYGSPRQVYLSMKYRF